MNEFASRLRCYTWGQLLTRADRIGVSAALCKRAKRRQELMDAILAREEELNAGELTPGYYDAGNMATTDGLGA